jgi:hypothetical protein
VLEGFTSDEALKWEIAENLHRCELTTLERKDHEAKWIEITGEQEVQKAKLIDPQVAEQSKKTQRNPKGAGRKEEAISMAVRELGISRDEAERAIKIAALPEDAKQAARETGMDRNQSVLLAQW